MPASALQHLTDKQKEFVLEYAASMDKIDAAREAGFQGDRKQLCATAHKMLRSPKIQAALAEVGTRLDGKALTIDNLAMQLARFTFIDPAEFMDEEGYLKCNIKDLPVHVRQCIKGFDIEEKTYRDVDGDIVNEKKIKVLLVDKLKAVELAMKWKQMLLPASLNVNLNQQNNYGITPEQWAQFFTAEAQENPPNVIEGKFKELENGNN